MGYKEMYEEWLNNPYFDDATKALREMKKRSKTVFIWILSLVRQVSAA